MDLLKTCKKNGHSPASLAIGDIEYCHKFCRNIWLWSSGRLEDLEQLALSFEDAEALPPYLLSYVPCALLFQVTLHQLAAAECQLIYPEGGPSLTGC